MPEQLPQVSKLAGALTEHQRWFESLPSDDRQWVIKHPKEAIGMFVNAVRNRDRTKLFNPHTYFIYRKGLWVSVRFTTRILAKQPTAMPYRGLEGVTSDKLARDMAGQQIIDEMLGGIDEVSSHPFTLDQVAEKIDLQLNGEDGELLNNGDNNIFYVLVDEVLFVVSVNWSSAGRKWHVFDWHLGEYGLWLAGTQVFRNSTLAI